MDSKEIEKRRLTLDDLAHRDEESGTNRVTVIGRVVFYVLPTDWEF